MTFDKFIETRINYMATLTNEDRAKLKTILGSSLVLTALNHVLMRREEIAVQLMQTDLSTPAGVSAALKLQGESLGVHNAVERLFSLIGEEDA